jgi:hypothetical protein
MMSKAAAIINRSGRADHEAFDGVLRASPADVKHVAHGRWSPAACASPSTSARGARSGPAVERDTRSVDRVGGRGGEEGQGLSYLSGRRPRGVLG